MKLPKFTASFQHINKYKLDDNLPHNDFWVVWCRIWDFLSHKIIGFTWFTSRCKWVCEAIHGYHVTRLAVM